VINDDMNGVKRGGELPFSFNRQRVNIGRIHFQGLSNQVLDFLA
jgi:hypothetical protein